MKYTVLILCLNLLVSVSSAIAADPPASAEELRSQLESALKAKDRNAIKALFNQRGVSEEEKSFDEITFDDLVKPDTSIKSVTLSPLPKDFQSSNDLIGIHSNIPV